MTELNRRIESLEKQAQEQGIGREPAYLTVVEKDWPPIPGDPESKEQTYKLARPSNIGVVEIRHCWANQNN